MPAAPTASFGTAMSSVSALGTEHAQVERVDHVLGHADRRGHPLGRGELDLVALPVDDRQRQALA